MKIKGEIIGGLGRATRLGFPTFNIKLPKGIIESGVYAGRAYFIGNEFNAVLFADTRREVLEAHLLDLDTDEREPEIEIEILYKIREAKKFKNDEELIRAIKKDIKMVI